MLERFKHFIREPLVHFLIIGMAIFSVYGLTRDLSSEEPGRILVTVSQQEQMAANFKRTWMRSPSEAELAGLVENHVREEVFYREALAMGLDQNDPLVRRRMQMKLEFILEDLSSQHINDEVLESFLRDNPDKFQTEVQLSFQHVFLNPDKRNNLREDAKRILKSLKEGAAIEKLGDSTLTPSTFDLATQSEIARTFGERFTEEVIGLQPGDWVGPFKSAYGIHLLKVTARLEAQTPALTEVRDLVEREYSVEKRKQQKDLAYQRLRENYSVTIESADSESGVESDLIASALAGESDEK